MARGDYEEIGSTSWHDVAGMTELGGMIYLVSERVLYAVNPATGVYREVGDDRWEARLLMAAQEALFLLGTDGTLYRIEPRSGRYTEHGDRYAWPNAVAGAVVGNEAICLFERGSLYAIDVATGRYRGLGSDTWNPLLACGLGKLYLVDHDGTMYRVELADGRWSYVGDDRYAWADAVRTAATVGNFIYLVSGDRIHKLDPTVGDHWRLSSETWDLLHLVGCGERLIGLARNGTLYAFEV